ncbi:MAG: DEAD/DEAH box helicase, partial [Gemmataceae bacterium]|nr:DEAD/DEAH box helicase [Gemmataceae bacterium]
ERQRMLRKPPHVLITTPESLHILLTSKARDTLRHLSVCIVDEIHALAPNKRGVFLSLLLERLEELNPAGFQRIGLSATQRPLEEVARYLGGARDDGVNYTPRPVTIVDAGLRKNLDLRVLCPVEQFGPLPEKTVWPSIYRLLCDQIANHRSTLVFANNRRTVERITVHLQELLDSGTLATQEHNVVFPVPSPLTPDPSPPQGRGERLLTPDTSPHSSQGETVGQTFLSAGANNEQTPIQVKAHHGSVSLEVRQATEEALKEGRLRAVVATASLELGIDMGAIDLVFQVETTGNVARALQRVGRAGHLVGQESKGRLIPKTLPDLLSQAVLAAEMAAGRVEEIRVPANCLDVLAQQIVAMTAMESWDVQKLFRTVRRAYPYRDLSPQAFDAVLQMITGRYQFPALDPDAQGRHSNPNAALSALQPRISWDRVHDRLEALPGSQHLALVQGGTIPDTGQFAVVTENNLRLGEVDEEFIWERRAGDTFLLGTNAWRIGQIGTDRVVVHPAEGAPALVPFWRGEGTGRSYDLGIAQGRFIRELDQRLDDPRCMDWLKREHFLETAGAKNIRDFVRRQKARTGVLPHDRLLTVEALRDPLGDWQVILLSPFGNRVHLTLRLAFENILRERLGYRPQALHHDDGVILRLTESDEPMLDIFNGLTPENLQNLVLDELADSALFAMRFRQNAARALLMPRGQPGKRAPLWLQRLRGRDLLQVARRFADFPIVVETFRECLQDHLDVPRTRDLLRDIVSGDVCLQTLRLEAPSPFAAALLFSFQSATMYEYDGVEAEPSATYSRLDQHLLDQLVGEGKGLALDPRAVAAVDQRLRGVGRPPRSKAEMAEWLRRLGDAAPAELDGAMENLTRELEAEGRAKRIQLADVAQPERWVLTEVEPEYRLAFADPLTPDPSPSRARGESRQEAAQRILFRFLETRALVGLADVLARYPLEERWAKDQIEEWAKKGRLLRVASPQQPQEPHWSAPANWEQMQRGTLALMRREVVPRPPTQFVDFTLRWHGVRRDGTLQHESAGTLDERLHALHGLFLPAELWEAAILPARLAGYQPRRLDEALAGGAWLWAGRGGESGVAQTAFFPRAQLAEFAAPALEGMDMHAAAERVHDVLQARGALFVPDLAQATGLSPHAVRAGLWSLVRRGLVTNDSFDVVRRGEAKEEQPSEETVRRPARTGVRTRSATRRGVGARAQSEGRWTLIPWGAPDPETLALASARRLLGRYGIVAREIALLDDTMPPWRVLYEILSRLEMAGDVRRGYFVEGLSGAQFALPEAARMLQDVAGPTRPPSAPVLVHSLDPANLYGSGAPLDILLLEGGTRPFQRRLGNWLVLDAGQPALLIEQHGKRLTALPSARRESLAQTVAVLPGIVGKQQLRDPRHKLTVETWNEQPVTATQGKELLEAAGFVRDYQAMTWYAVWH